MRCIDILVAEHDNILRMLDVVRAASLRALTKKEVDVEDFRLMIDFIRKYADKTHHGKEEEFLFKEMVDELGAMGDNLVRHGMLVEHDLGRLYVSDWETALNAYEKSPSDENRLDILVAAGSYASLLHRHIEKENTVVFPFGGRSLSNAALARVEEQTSCFEEDEKNAGVRNEQLSILDFLEQKYIK